MIISFGLLSRAIKISVYHSITSNSFLTCILSITIYLANHDNQPETKLPSFKYLVHLAVIVTVSLLAHILQGISFRQKSPRQLSLVTYLQPVFTTALQTIFLDRSLDVLPLAGSVLIAANMWAQRLLILLSPPLKNEQWCWPFSSSQ